LESHLTFDDRVTARFAKMSPAEQRVIRFFRDNREEVLIASAAALASQAETSDATVVRAVKGLGFAGLDDLRRCLAAELRNSQSPAARLARTLGEVGDDLQAAFNVTLDIHLNSLESLRRDITPDLFRQAVDKIIAARRVLVFGVGPSSAMAEYLVIQLGRFGLDAASLTRTGLLFADDLQKLRSGDVAIIMAYGRLYRELAVLLDATQKHGVGTVLLTDTLAAMLNHRVDLVLSVARGRADLLSMHTATLGLIEAILVGVATRRPQETLASLKAINDARAKLVDEATSLTTRRRDV
jgi:DNA-binding MurR/RpiR family transcriptional regulator